MNPSISGMRKIEPRWKFGIWLGIAQEYGEYIVGNKI